ncbi:MAG: glycoside hydrolase family 5 protein [Bacteroidia bacterium]|nr:glycoside hydrolase family 5 protein [Bacteroidia bacterium]
MTKTRIYYKVIAVLAGIFFIGNLLAQAPFTRGVNLSGWFQVNSPGEIQFTKFTKKDIANIKSLGCDVIRLPINMHAMTKGSPAYKLDPLYLSFLDSAVKWCEELNIYLMLDNHSFDPAGETQQGIADILVKVWSQMAAHYKDRSNLILYEVLNEPHGMSTSVWGAIQNQAIAAIRAYDTKHTIVVGGSGWNTYTELKNLPVYNDANLLYTFHFYDPFMFTHQGATWTDPSMDPLAGVPFPYNSAEMPACPASLKGTWIESGLNNYPSQGNIAYVKQLIDNAVSFRNSRNANVFCGEFGVYMKNSDDADRCYWYKAVKDYLEEKNIPWTIWDYKGGFGVFKKGSGQIFEHDLNIKMIDSLDLKIPEQTPFTIKPDSTGFFIYTDYIGEKIDNASFTSGLINFYSNILPSNGQYCLNWSDFGQYNSVKFDFVPDKDLSGLRSKGYALDFIVRGNDPGIKFDIRFKDTKTDATDHPWRIRTVIDNNYVSWDRRWHHVRIPLTAFTEHGSWDNGTWYNPEGKFDWTKIDDLEISTEYVLNSGVQIWFDNIHISELDTAIVRVSDEVGIEDHSGYGKIEVKAAPNPFRYYTEISFSLEKKMPVRIDIWSCTGIKVRSLPDRDPYPGQQLILWDGSSGSGQEVPTGIYYCLIYSTCFIGAISLLKIL